MRFWNRRKDRIVAAIDDLTAAVNRVVTDLGAARSQISDLQAQVATLQSGQGTPDSTLEALTAQIDAADPAPAVDTTTVDSTAAS